MSTDTSFVTPEDAETAFYEALENASLEDMMKVWADDEEIICVVPGGHRLVGHDAIRAAWRDLFARRKQVQIRIARAVHWAGPMLAIHSIVETIQVDGEQVDTPIAATNVFVRNASGWRLLVHHASAVQGSLSDTAHPSSQTLH
jgi:uncharacterized protein (TIGR02246 family)